VFFDPDSKMSLTLGSCIYMAPELCGRRQYDERVDVWSLGVITYIMMTGEPPFIGENENVTKKKIQTTKPAFEHQQW